MKKYFFSQNNITYLTKKLIILLNLDKEEITKEIIIKCNKIILNFMTLIFEKYGNMKPPNITDEVYIDKLNKKSLSDCLRTINNKKKYLIIAKVEFD